MNLILWQVASRYRSQPVPTVYLRPVPAISNCFYLSDILSLSKYCKLGQIHEFSIDNQKHIFNPSLY